jgi:hypothetical protein
VREGDERGRERVVGHVEARRAERGDGAVREGDEGFERLEARGEEGDLDLDGEPGVGEGAHPCEGRGEGAWDVDDAVVDGAGGGEEGDEGGVGAPRGEGAGPLGGHRVERVGADDDLAHGPLADALEGLGEGGAGAAQDDAGGAGGEGAGEVRGGAVPVAAERAAELAAAEAEVDDARHGAGL